MSESNNSNVLSVLAVDDDVVSLRILSCKLQQCGFKVTATTKATEALVMLKENKDGFDIVLTDIVMPDMDGFKLLEIIRKINIPVIMISADGEAETVVKGIKSGAEDYFVKPVKIEALKQKLPEYVIKKSQSTEKCNEDETTKICKTESEHIEKYACVCQLALKKKLPEFVTERSQSTDQSMERCNEDETMKINETDSVQDASPQKKRKKKGTESDQNGSPQKKKRTIWNSYLHTKFVKAVSQIEASNEPDNKVIPKNILQIMNEPGLTRECVASHLQKYRRGIIKKSQGDDNNEQDPVSSLEFSHATENMLDSNGQHEQSGFGSGNLNNSNRIFTYPINMLPPANMLQQDYFHLNPISPPIVPNAYCSQPLMLERRNSIPLNNAYQMSQFGMNHIPSQYGTPPFAQYPNAFTYDLHMHRGLPNQMVVQPPQIPSSQGHNDVLKENHNPAGDQPDTWNVNFRMKENLNDGGETNGSCSRMNNTFDGNEQPMRTEQTQQHPNDQSLDRQNSFGFDDEMCSLLGLIPCPPTHISFYNG